MSMPMPPSGQPAYGPWTTFTLNVRAVPVNNSLPVAVSPSIVVQSDKLVASYSYYDADGHPEWIDGRLVRWYRDSGAGFVHAPSFDNLLEIAPTRIIDERWYVSIACHDGYEQGAFADSVPVWIGDSWDITVVIDKRRTQTFTDKNVSTRGGRRAVRFPLKPYMRGRMARIRLEASSLTRLHGFDIGLKANRGTIR